MIILVNDVQTIFFSLLVDVLLRGNLPNCQIAFEFAIVSNDRPRLVIKYLKRVWFSRPPKQRYKLITVLILLYYSTDICNIFIKDILIWLKFIAIIGHLVFIKIVEFDDKSGFSIDHMHLSHITTDH